MSRPYSWDQLRRLSLARQFPRVRGAGVGAVAAVADRVGPLQTQTARSAFLGLAARLPGLDHATLTRAYESHALVRGSTIRGTVHTSTPQQHVWLERATRVGQRAVWVRTLRLGAVPLEEVWAGIEEFATPSWREVDELAGHLRDWLVAHGESPPEQLGSTLGRALSFGHGGLVRRPLGHGTWDSQARPGYRAVAAVLADRRPEIASHLVELRSAPHDEAMAAVVLLHLRSHGPASRQDIAWWSGLGLREVDAAVDSLAEALDRREGPDGRTYLDVVDGVPRPVDDVGTRLLPEFDALLCGYHPQARDRFLTAEQHALLWNQQNGLLRAPVLHAGRIAGWWRLEGSGRRRRLQVTTFAGSPEPSTADLDEAAARAAAVLDLEIEVDRVATEPDP